jgi:hypothetical protein
MAIGALRFRFGLLRNPFGYQLRGTCGMDVWSYCYNT